MTAEMQKPQSLTTETLRYKSWADCALLIRRNS